MTKKFDLVYLVGPKDHQKRIDLVISIKNQELSRSRVKALIEQGNVRLDESTVTKASATVVDGQKISIHIPAPQKLELTARHDVDIRILYEDESLSVLEKPAGISVHPSHTENEPTVVHGLLAKLNSLSSVGGVERPGIVHRIDKGTSGILVISKTDVAHEKLSAQFKAHTIKRKYKTLIYGDPKQKSQKIETFYGRSQSNRKKMTGKLTSGRKAVTHYKLIEPVGSHFSLLECQLETGRTHQIRVHLSEAGMSIVGDPVYGEHKRKAAQLKKKFPELSERCELIDHQLLHAWFLGFEHPLSKKWIEFESSLPKDFAEFIDFAKGF